MSIDYVDEIIYVSLHFNNIWVLGRNILLLYRRLEYKTHEIDKL